MRDEPLMYPPVGKRQATHVDSGIKDLLQEGLIPSTSTMTKVTYLIRLAYFHRHFTVKLTGDNFLDVMGQLDNMEDIIEGATGRALKDLTITVMPYTILHPE